jgi:hypothetical protein
MKTKSLPRNFLFPRKRSNKARSSVRTLQTRIWIEALFRDNQINRKTLEEVISNADEPSGQILKWLKGKNTVSASKVSRIDKIFFSGSSEIYFLPLFQLLEDRLISKNELKRVVQEISHEEGFGSFWQLPNYFCGEKDGLPIGILGEENCDALYQRGGIYSFIAILYLVRKAEAAGDGIQHFHAMSYAYKSFPSLARNRYFYRRWRELFAALIQVHLRVPTSWFLVQPNKELLKRQIEAKKFVTYRPCQPRDPISGRFTENEDPFYLATFPHFGTEKMVFDY